MTPDPDDSWDDQPLWKNPVDSAKRPVENPARKILDAMSLNLKNQYKSLPRSSTSDAREAIHNLDQILGGLLDAVDLTNARIDALEAAFRERWGQ